MSVPSKTQKPFLQALAGETLSPPPVWLMRQAGRYLPEYRATREEAGGFLDLCYTPKLAVEVTLQPLRRYAFDAAILFSDILVVPNAIGRQVAFKQGEGPVLDPLTSRADVEALEPGKLRERLGPVFETVRGLASAIPSTTALIGFAGAPWTVATYMLEGGSSKDFSVAKSWIYSRPDDFAALMEVLISATTDYLIAQIDAGAEAIQIFDTWAGVLPETEFHRWVIEPIGRITRALHEQRPGVPVIGFPKGAGVLYETFIRETGVDGVGLDASVPLAWAAKTLQPLCTVQGNMDPLLLVEGGPLMEQAVKRLLDTLGHGPFIFNLGHGIVPQTPPENVARLIDLVRAPR
ncbi:uroporphyrinogen decarboxylase [Rhodospirillum rubrum]|uniref:Uroporphyrinogen decarboxylase n=1 Tax=Rhodospirillum rubrum (strain ATCC 11170 / ATH 1.1.1 / DSM 467 / LMG 4362 / NCIMB 8255 / S1) TaxID=269796 RepID=DCUP_RHORT|nr:uroporphyrinogen decarboxylase [Rhodospirillum rubrum]Q2RN85.1 RecName: Full=Uroporphyrinogen decarboxylase; Short=UPD; Short=URO-D [Rhodospirillum rubrum ATCC 11170]ABC24410.1 uroporphyrinogen decarboxylase [Rhodospirillum rubrum ATCC 11170]AEO50161.1 uroporphyrinogen decarboxylase [Rhodospirillum rubrum F11]MBK5956130.1 uroporphyrinogen decarboxylase [Rhodospirillum rubrum]QXG80333.1 uroporphyrinogen decarboxylase [Rhodospirillum rubrum]HAQ00080.1 uroporphyrinogen decarboxylase [Rhodospi